MVVTEERVKQKIKKYPEASSGFILMVDDDPLTNYINRKLLLHVGASAYIQTFVNGFDALNTISSICSGLAEENSDLCILLDLQMVEMDGIEFLDRLKEMDLPFKTRIYILSGSMPVHRLKKLREFSLAGFFLKPLSKGNVKEILMPLKPVYFNRK